MKHIKMFIITMITTGMAMGVSAYTNTVNGYTYEYEVWALGVNISPIYNTSSHNAIPAVSPTPSGDFVIPTHLPDASTNYLPVVNIGHYFMAHTYSNPTRIGKAFSSGLMTSVKIPDTVVNIGITAFADCTALVSVDFPKNLVTLDDYTFANCPKLTRIELPKGFIGTGTSTFTGCTGLTEVVFHDGLKYIGASTFSSNTTLNWYGLSGSFLPCINLAEIVLPESVTNVGTHAFSGCMGLHHATIGGGEIRESAFYQCTGLTELSLGNGVTGIGQHAFEYCTSLTEVVIPGSITNIDNFAFGGCSNLSRVVICEGVKRIGRYAFWGCTNISEIVIPMSVEEIGEDAFMCSELRKVTIPGHLGLTSFTKEYRGNITNIVVHVGSTNICSDAFSYCYGLKSVTIPDSVRSIGIHAFEHCGLEEVRLPVGLTEIGTGVFQYGCLTNVPAFPSGITTIPDWTFYHNSGFISITIPYGIEHIGNSAFNDCELLSDVTIPDSVITIGHEAFFKAWSLTNVTIGANVRDIGSRAFFGDMIEHATIPAGVTNLAYSMAFGACNLSSVLILGDVDGLQGIFEYCDNLKRVILLGNVTGEEVEDPFYGMPDDFTFYVTSAWRGPDEAWEGRPVKVVSRAAATIIGKKEKLFCDWLASSILERADNDVFVAADFRAANGKRNVAECYVLGIDPEDPNDDLKIIDFKMRGGRPVITLNHVEDGSGESFLPRVRTLGKANLLDTEWHEVPENGYSFLRFFKVEVELP